MTESKIMLLLYLSHICGYPVTRGKHTLSISTFPILHANLELEVTQDCKTNKRKKKEDKRITKTEKKHYLTIFTFIYLFCLK